MEHKAFKATAMGEQGTGSAVIATLGVVDKDDDVLLAGVFGRQPTRIVPAHDWSSVMLGRAVVSEKGNQAIADLAFNLDLPTAKEWHSSLKFDLANEPALQEWSWGFEILPGAAYKGELDGKDVRFIGPLKDGSPGVTVFEVSPVLIGSGIGTRTVSMKNHGQTYADEIKQLLARTAEIAELRTGKGKDFSPERLEELKELRDQLGQFIATCSATPEAPSADEAVQLFAEYQRTRYELIRAGVG